MPDMEHLLKNSEGEDWQTHQTYCTMYIIRPTGSPQDSTPLTLKPIQPPIRPTRWTWPHNSPKKEKKKKTKKWSLKSEKKYSFDLLTDRKMLLHCNANLFSRDEKMFMLWSIKSFACLMLTMDPALLCLQWLDHYTHCVISKTSNKM